MDKPLPVELLERYIAGNCTAAEVALVKQWYQSFEHDDDHVSGLAMSKEKELEDRIFNHILLNINAGEEPEEVYAAPRRIGRWYALAGAAAAVFILAAAILFYKRQAAVVPLNNSDASQIVDITNNSSKIYKATLPDNSFVWINPHSQLSYPKNFAADARIVSMSGECFFEVTKNPKRPFIISSRSIITRVWGTSFLVRDDEQSNSADVSVVTGKVSVSVKTKKRVSAFSLQPEKDEVILYPHQKVVYLIDQHLLKPENTGVEPALQIYNHLNLSFENKPLKDIIPLLDSKYHVHITVANERLNHYILNADLAGFNLPDVLEALKKSLNVSYQIKGSDIELEQTN